MADATKMTTRFKFQKIGGSQEMEPNDYNALLDALDAQVSEVAHLPADFTFVAGAALTWERPQATRRLRVTLTNLVLTLAGATTSCCASSGFITMPAASHLALVAARMNLTWAKDGVTLLAADQPLLALGSVAASVSTLATTAQNIVGNQTLAATASGATAANGAGNIITAPIYFAKGASNKVFLNCGISSKAGGTLTVNGTVDLFYDEFGNFADIT